MNVHSYLNFIPISARRRQEHSQESSPSRCSTLWAIKSSYVYFPLPPPYPRSHHHPTSHLSTPLQGLYPTIIIVLVHQKRTLWDVSNISWTTPTLDTIGSPGQIQAGTGSRSWGMRQVSEVGNQTSVVTTMRFGDRGRGEGEGEEESEQDSEVRSKTESEVREEAEKRLA